MTHIGEPTEVYVVIDGVLTKQKIIQKRRYHLFCGFLDDEIVLVEDSEVSVKKKLSLLWVNLKHRHRLQVR